MSGVRREIPNPADALAILSSARTNQKPPNLLHFVYDNEAYDTTGGQPTPGAGMVDFEAVARGAGYAETRSYDELAALDNDLPAILNGRWLCL